MIRKKATQSPKLRAKAAEARGLICLHTKCVKHIWKIVAFWNMASKWLLQSFGDVMAA